MSLRVPKSDASLSLRIRRLSGPSVASVPDHAYVSHLTCSDRLGVHQMRWKLLSRTTSLPKLLNTLSSSRLGLGFTGIVYDTLAVRDSEKKMSSNIVHPSWKLPVNSRISYFWFKHNAQSLANLLSIRRRVGVIVYPGTIFVPRGSVSNYKLYRYNSELNRGVLVKI